MNEHSVAPVGLAATMPAADPQPPRRGSGAMRVLALGLAGALLFGSAGYVVSVAMDPQQVPPATMCVDSNCTFAMSAGMQPGDPMMARATAHHMSAAERLVRDALSVLHIH